MWHRNQFVRLLMEKDESDRALLSSEQSENWYTIDSNVVNEELRGNFVPLNLDKETSDFLQCSLDLSNSLCLQVYYSFFASMLSLFLTKTSINGLLGRGKMFIFSRGHLRSLLGIPDDWSLLGRRLLDVGAGDGAVTDVFQSFYSDVSVVEASKIMEWRLANRGFHVLPLDKWPQSGPYDLISAMNLLDRHHDPAELLRNLHKLALEHSCPVLLSVVLPLRHYVEFKQKPGNPPASTIPVIGRTFESQLNSLVQHTLEPAGFEVIRWTKLPYLCEGDLSRAYYVLNDAIFFLRAKQKLLPPGPAHDQTFKPLSNEVEL